MERTRQKKKDRPGKGRRNLKGAPKPRKVKKKEKHGKKEKKGSVMISKLGIRFEETSLGSGESNQ